MRRAKAHHGREDPISWFRLADGFAVGGGEGLFTRCVEQANNKKVL